MTQRNKTTGRGLDASISPVQPGRSRWILLLSFLVNVGLLLNLGLKARPHQVVAPPEIVITTNTPAETSASATNPLPPVATAPPDFDWTRLVDDDLAVYAANLRTVGCPEKTVRDIILPLIEKQFAQRREKLEREDAFWQTADQRELGRQDAALKATALNKDRLALVKSILGFEWDSKAIKDWDRESEFVLLAGFLPEGKPERIACILKKYVDQFEFRSLNLGIQLPEDAARLQGLYRQMMTELEQEVSPSDFTESKLRFIYMISYLFHNGMAIESRLTGPELRQIMSWREQLCNPLEHEFYKEDEEALVRFEQGEKVLLANVQALLGDARFVGFLKAHDNDFAGLMETAEQLKLPASTALKGFGIKEMAEAEAGRIRHNTALNRSERRQQLQSIHDSTAQTLAELFGSNLNNSYLTNSPEWLKALARP